MPSTFGWPSKRSFARRRRGLVLRDGASRSRRQMQQEHSLYRTAARCGAAQPHRDRAAAAACAGGARLAMTRSDSIGKIWQRGMQHNCFGMITEINMHYSIGL